MKTAQTTFIILDVLLAGVLVWHAIVPQAWRWLEGEQYGGIIMLLCISSFCTASFSSQNAEHRKENT